MRLGRGAQGGLKTALYFVRRVKTRGHKVSRGRSEDRRPRRTCVAGGAHGLRQPTASAVNASGR